MKVAACITARNECKTIGLLVRLLRRYGYDVFVADAGSTDGTGDIAHFNGAEVVRHDKAPGIGPALVDLWKIAYEEGYDAVVQIDAGGSHYPPDAKRLVRALEEGVHVVVGSRFIEGSWYTGRPLRKRLSQLASRKLNEVTGFEFTDWTSGFRVFSREALWSLARDCYKTKMHGWQIEVLHLAAWLGLDVREVPIRYAAGRSSLNWRIAWEAFGVWKRLHRNWKEKSR